MQCCNQVRSLALLSTGMALLFPLRSVKADVLVNQQPGGGNLATTYSQEYTDAGFPDPSVSQYIFDDFTVGTGGWKIDQVTAYGQGDSQFDFDPGINKGVVLGIGTTPDIYSVDRYSGIEVKATSGFNKYNLVFTFSTPLYLAPGTYWLTPFVQRDFSNFGWFFRQHGPVSGSEAYFQNPSGDLTGGDPNAIPYSQTSGTGAEFPVDLAFRIDGTVVPEPGSVALLVGMGLSGAGFLAHRGKKARRIA